MGRPGAMAEFIRQAQPGQGLTLGQPAESQERAGIEHLLFVCAGVPCAAPLAELREALPTMPRTTQLPFSPPWLLGLFPLRTEIIGLVDPTPLLTGAGRTANNARPDPWNATRSWAADAQSALAAVGAQAEPWRWGAAAGVGATAGGALGADVFGISGPRGGAQGTLFTPGGVPTALTRAILVGDGARSLALVVDALGAIARVQDGEIVGAAASGASSTPAPLPFDARYVAGVYTPVGGGRHFVVLQMTTLLDDLLDALEQPEEGRHDAR